ncbi:cyclic nucleotide-binding domain-containing protein [Marinimicrobium sp. ABcell2]|uniref:cyclic nucleotide-binding domain-containing protein n=1 Tax=Marinimicrobium sp. ABcell2 TaxID=3069751 RepID=UPI0027B40220|nr:cyclic nucleotide-binding domain-containing protein [Marinimicrobium sp. ABcell2]MDQ2075063.1 cyclic nucleotide-binding domain-containing protein [Marinimicrobium sp. ABcell2]
MEIRPLQKFPRDKLEQLLLTVPFYKSIKQQDNWQFEILLQHSRIACFSPGEVVLQRGERDQWLYFLLKGRLQVFPDELCQGEPVNLITPGEVFGDLAMLVGSERTATLIADPSCREVMVFASDFRVFGDLEAIQPISLQTKLTYYRNTVHNLRWKLEVYRSQNPQHSFANKHRQVKLYTGVKGTLEELRALHAQAQALARLLLEWNGEFGNRVATDATAQAPD